MADEWNNIEALRKLFVGGLNRSTSDEVFKEYFSPWGEIEDSVIIKDDNTNESRGFGFITYSHFATADEVLKNRYVSGAHKVTTKPG